MIRSGLKSRAICEVRSSMLFISTIRPPLLTLPSRQVLEVLDAGQLGKVFQTKLNQKLFRGAVHHRPADSFFPPTGYDEALVEQGLDRGRRLHAANLKNLRHGDRLFVG